MSTKPSRRKSFKNFKRRKSIASAMQDEGTMNIEDPAKPTNVSPLLIWYYFGRENIFIFLGLIGATGFGCIPVLFFFIMGEMINGLQPSTSISTSFVINTAESIKSVANFGVTMAELGLKMTYVAIGAMVAMAMITFFMNFAHGRVGTQLKRAYFNSLMDQEIGYFDMKRTGQLLSDMTENMELVQETYTNKLGELATHLTQVLFGFIMALVTGWKISLVMIAILPVMVMVLMTTGTGVTFTQKLLNRLTGQAANVSNEVVSSMRTVRSMDGEEREKQRVSTKLASMHKVIFLKALVIACTVPCAIFLAYGDIALGYWYGGQLVVKGEMATGDTVKVYGYVMMSIIGIASALRIMPEFGKASQNVRDLLLVIRRKPLMPPSGGVQPEKIEGNIEFKDVTFSYPTRPSVQVLKNFNLTIRPGQAVALVGASGSGKSTIVGLIEKFYRADSGMILLDGQDLNEIDPRWLHRNIGIVTQEPTLFAATIKENILYAVQQSGRQYTDQDVIDAAIAANAHDFITSLPDGYNTMLGERGVSMSGGQKQRIAIARAMIQDPKLLLLDEATSALDTQSESIVQEALNKLMQGRTSIIIAHRLSTIIDSDVIVVMNRGEIREIGTHLELINRPDGYYRKLAAKQMLLPNQDKNANVSSSDVGSDSASDSDNESPENDEKEDRELISIEIKS